MAVAPKSQVVWKYLLQFVDRQEVELPQGARLLTIVNQGEQAVLYALVDPTQTEKDTRIIWCHGTGHPVTEPGITSKYLTTTLFSGGVLVFHWFVELSWTEALSNAVGFHEV